MSSLPDWARGSDLTYRQLNHWCDKGYLRPEGQGLGSGYQREWPVRERRMALMMSRLVSAGVARPELAHKIAREALRNWETWSNSSSSGHTTVIVAPGVYVNLTNPPWEVPDDDNT